MYKLGECPYCGSVVSENGDKLVFDLRPCTHLAWARLGVCYSNKPKLFGEDQDRVASGDEWRSPFWPEGNPQVLSPRSRCEAFMENWLVERVKEHIPKSEHRVVAFNVQYQQAGLWWYEVWGLLVFAADTNEFIKDVAKLAN